MMKRWLVETRVAATWRLALPSGLINRNERRTRSMVFPLLRESTLARGLSVLCPTACALPCTPSQVVSMCVRRGGGSEGLLSPKISPQRRDQARPDHPTRGDLPAKN